MKKVFLFAAMTALLLSLTACGTDTTKTVPSDPSSSVSSSVSSSTSSSASQLDESSVEDNLDGLVKYLASKGVVQGTTTTKMDASFIGAKSGIKYKYSYEGKDVLVELYEYDTSALNETAKKVIDSVKKDRKFVMMDHDVKATLSDSGKYLLIYTDNATAEKNVTHKTESEKTFKAFKK